VIAKVIPIANGTATTMAEGDPERIDYRICGGLLATPITELDRNEIQHIFLFSGIIECWWKTDGE
jgi:hypothetical protein